MKVFKEEKKHLLLLVGLVTLITLLIWLPSLITGRPITYGTDLKPQWYQFYFEFNKLITNFIKNRVLPFYSWDLFLGNNFYASKGYYMMGDIYAYIGLIDLNFISKNFFDMARNITYLKFIVSSISFYLYLTAFDRKPLTKVICSIAYTFSGWAIFYSGQLVFLSFYSFVPLFLLGIEEYLRHNRYLLFILITALLFSTNFYFFYTLSAFTPIYFLARYFMLNIQKNKLFVSVLKIIGYYIIGALISAFIWLPAVIYVLGSNRFGSGSDYGIFYTYKSNLFALCSMFIPDYLIIYRNNIFDSASHVEREICLYSSSILALLIPQYFLLAEKKNKQIIIIIYLVFLLVLVFTPLASFIHGFGDPYYRWVFVIVITNLLLISYVLDRIKELNNRILFITLVVSVCLLIGSYFVCLFIGSFLLSEYLTNLYIFIIFSVLMLLGYRVIGRKNLLLITIIVVIEIGSSCFYNYLYDVKAQPDMTYEFFDSVTTTIATYPNEINETLNSLHEGNDQEFYRVFIPYGDVYWYTSQNMSVFFDLKGVLTYDSSLNTAFSSMSSAVPEITYGCSWIIDIQDKNLLDFLNVKYAVSTKDYEINLDDWIVVKDNYLGQFKIYENKNYRPLLTSYEKIMFLPMGEKIDDSSVYLDTVVTNNQTLINEIKSKLSDAKVEVSQIDANNNYVTAKIASNKNGYVVSGIPYDKGWKLKIDSKEIYYNDVNGGFIGFEIPEGIHDLAMYFIPVGFKQGIALSIAGILLLTIQIILSIKKERRR